MKKSCPAFQGYPTCRGETTRLPELSRPPRRVRDPDVNGWLILQRNKLKLTSARVTRGEGCLGYPRPWAFSIYKKFRKISSGNSGNFRLGKGRSICHKSHSFTSPSPSLHQKTRCLGKLFCYFLERVFVHRFPVKQMVIIGMYGYEKSGICMFLSF